MKKKPRSKKVKVARSSKKWDPIRNYFMHDSIYGGYAKPPKQKYYPTDNRLVSETWRRHYKDTLKELEDKGLRADIIDFMMSAIICMFNIAATEKIKSHAPLDGAELKTLKKLLNRLPATNYYSTLSPVISVPIAKRVVQGKRIKEMKEQREVYRCDLINDFNFIQAVVDAFIMEPRTKGKSGRKHSNPSDELMRLFLYFHYEGDMKEAEAIKMMETLLTYFDTGGYGHTAAIIRPLLNRTRKAILKQH